MGKIFYIADLHLGHSNIIRLSKRPFNNVAEMDNALIDNWNKVVSDVKSRPMNEVKSNPILSCQIAQANRGFQSVSNSTAAIAFINN